ncbi:MAG TPA: TadE family protein, partial [Mycobacteriales bacterium]|nr:TadE family protein [Mycobacteriales bacterium]
QVTLRVLRLPRGERGSAPVDFVLVGTLVTLMFLAIVQLGIDYHVRNVLAACAAEGARYGANADVASADAGASRANELIKRSVGARFATAVAAPEQDSIDGAPVVTVTVTAHLPLFAWFLPVGPSVHAVGHALLEHA